MTGREIQEWVEIAVATWAKASNTPTKVIMGQSELTAYNEAVQATPLKKESWFNLDGLVQIVPSDKKSELRLL